MTQSNKDAQEHPIDGNPDATTAETASKASPKKENMLVNIVVNIVIPTLILMKLSGDEHLGSKLALIVALLFPIGYGIKDFFDRGKVNIFSALGVISIVLTGGISLLELDPAYIAIKEAAIPGILGLATLITVKTRFPLVKVFLYNDKIMQVDKIADALAERSAEAAFEHSLRVASLLVAVSFFVSSFLNYVLAWWLLLLPNLQPNTEAYNEALGKMTALSFPVIAVPATLVMMAALFYLFRSIKKLTGLNFEEILNEP